MNLRHTIATAILVLSGLHPTSTPPIEVEHVEPGHAEVKGVVTDINDSRVQGVSVEFSGKNGTSKVITKSDGTYAIQLAPGTYKVRLSNFGFCEGHRGAFSLKNNSTVQFDFQLLVCGIYDTEGTPRSPIPSRLPDRYDEENLNAIASDGIRPLVMFGSKENRSESVQFSGFKFEGRWYPVIYSYNLLTITANTLSCSTKDNSIEGAGDVIWQDGSETRHGSKIHVSYLKGKPKITLAN